MDFYLGGKFYKDGNKHGYVLVTGMEPGRIWGRYYTIAACFNDVTADMSDHFWIPDMHTWKEYKPRGVRA